MSDLNETKELTTEQRFDMIITAIQGLNRSQWGKIELCVNTMYNSMAAELKIDDPEELRKRLGETFGIRELFYDSKELRDARKTNHEQRR